MGAPESQRTVLGASAAATPAPPTASVPEALVKRTALSVVEPSTRMLKYGGRGALAGQLGGMVKGVHAPGVGAGVGDGLGQPHVVAAMRVVPLHTPMPLLLPLNWVGMMDPSLQYQGPTQCSPE